MTTMARTLLVAGAFLVVAVPPALGERPIQERSDAELVITGIVRKVVIKKGPYGVGGVKASYEAEVVVDDVEIGDNLEIGKRVKSGDMVRVRWYCVTKMPEKALFDAYGHDYDIQEKVVGRFWLQKDPTDPFSRAWDLLYGSGFEKIEK